MVEEATPPADEPASDAPEAAVPQADDQAQPAQQQIRLRMDHREMSTSYANMVMTHSMPNEVLLDFGLNVIAPSTSVSVGFQISTFRELVIPAKCMSFSSDCTLIAIRDDWPTVMYSPSLV